MLKKNKVATPPPTAKKPVTKPSLKTTKRPAAPDPDEGDGSDDGDGEPDAEPEPPKKGLKKKIKTSQSLADLFDATKPRTGFTDFPIGEFRAIIANLEMDGEVADDIEDQEDLKIKITFEGHESEDDAAEKEISNFYNIFKDGEFHEMGVGFLKKDMDILGYPEISIGDLAELCEQVTAERPEVVIVTKQNGQYVNAYLQGLAD